MEIVTFPHEALNKITEIVDKKDTTITELVKGMLSLVDDPKIGALGLAAPQVGVSKRIFILNKSLGIEKRVFINPKIVYSSWATSKDFEGCLSFPGLTIEVERSNEVVIAYEDENRMAAIVNLEGIRARVAQHEFDHLMSVSILDYMEDKSAYVPKLPSGEQLSTSK